MHYSTFSNFATNSMENILKEKFKRRQKSEKNRGAVRISESADNDSFEKFQRKLTFIQILNNEKKKKKYLKT